MSSATVNGKAVIHGIRGIESASLSGWASISPLETTAPITQNFEEKTVKRNGFDVAWIATNQHYTLDLTFKPSATTIALAAGAYAFVAPLAKVTLSNFDETILNGDWTNMSGASIDFSDSDVAPIKLKLRKYVDSDQNTLATTAAS